MAVFFSEVDWRYASITQTYDDQFQVIVKSLDLIIAKNYIEFLWTGINVMSKKYQVFISSTFQDLIEQRDQAIQAVLDMGHIPIGMEMFSAANDEQWAIISRQIEDSDYYVLVVAHRYGSMDSSGVSYTEKEFDYAVSLGVPILAFIIEENAPWPAAQSESDPVIRVKLSDFKSKVKTRLIQFWQSKDELHGKISISLMKAFAAYPRTGWVRANEVAGPALTKELTRLSSENAELRDKLERAERARTSQEDELHAAVRILTSNKRLIKVRQTKDWTTAKIIRTTLAAIFEYSAPNLIVENSRSGVAQNIALGLVGTRYFQNYPIGSNIASGILADLAALDLVEASKKKHSIEDKNTYWTLTDLGRRALKSLRRVQLEAGLSIASLENDTDDNSEPAAAEDEKVAPQIIVTAP
jgi:hypothetical protein